MQYLHYWSVIKICCYSAIVIWHNINWPTNWTTELVFTAYSCIAHSSTLKTDKLCPSKMLVTSIRLHSITFQWKALFLHYILISPLGFSATDILPVENTNNIHFQHKFIFEGIWVKESENTEGHMVHSMLKVTSRKHNLLLYFSDLTFLVSFLVSIKQNNCNLNLKALKKVFLIMFVM